MPSFLSSAFPIETSLQLALLNIGVLLLTGIVSLLLTCVSVAWQRYRKERV